MKHRVRTSALLTILVALLTLGLVAPGSAATKTGAVTGVITLNGTPMKGLTVELYWTGDDGYEGKRVAVDTTDSKGAYSLTFSETNPLDPSDEFGHTVIITDPSHRIVSTIRRFTDHPDKIVTRNASVKAAGSISGSVKRGDAQATTRLQVDAFGPSDYLDPYAESVLTYDATAIPAADGSFALRGLPAGDYYLQFVDESKSYFSQCYDNVPAAGAGCDGTDGRDANGTKITVAAGQNVTLNSQVLSTTAHRILGTVTDTSGHPIRYANVTAVKGGSQSGPGDRSHSTGNFTIGPLTDGHYQLSVAPLSPWAPQEVTADIAGKDVSGVQIKLKSRASIRATFTPGKGSVKVAVDVTRSATGGKPSGTVTVRWGTVSTAVRLVKGEGTAKLAGLPKGTRRITIEYSGTPSTAATTKVFHTVVK
jgi:hypothetical protein